MSLDLTDDTGQRAWGTFTSGIAADTDFSVFTWFKRNPLFDTSLTGNVFELNEDTGTDGIGVIIPATDNIRCYGRVTSYASHNHAIVPGSLDDQWIPVLITSLGLTKDIDSYVVDASNTVHSTLGNFRDTVKNGLVLGSQGQTSFLPFSGLVSHICVWEGIKLTAANFTSLVAGIDPTLIETANVHSYYPLVDDLADHSGNGEVTLTAYAGTGTVPGFSTDEPFSPAFQPIEGIDLVLRRVYKNLDIDRGTSLVIGLFTDLDLSSASTWNAGAGVTQPTGGGYAEKTLADASWTISAGTASYAQQVWTAVTTGYTGTVQGYYVRTTGTTPRILFVQYHTSAQAIAVGDSYKVTPSIDMSDGIPGITVNEGIELALNLIFKNADANRGSSFSAGLYTNSTGLTTSTALATITTPSTGGYASQTLLDASWLVSDGVTIQPSTYWIASAAAYAATYGVYIFTTGTVPKLLHIDPHESSVTVADGQSYSFNPSLDVTSL